MIEKFLKAKHWQLFLFTFGIPILYQIILMINLIFNIDIKTNSDPEKMFVYLRFFPILMMIFMGVFFGWFWSVAIGLQKKVPEHVKMKINKFKVFFFIPMVYIFCVMVFMVYLIDGVSRYGIDHFAESPGALFTIIGPLHLFSMFCIFYTLYFVAKTFKTVELQREVSFSDFAGEFFMIWFFPIGIWIIQPKINKFVEE